MYHGTCHGIFHCIFLTFRGTFNAFHGRFTTVLSTPFMVHTVVPFNTSIVIFKGFVMLSMVNIAIYHGTFHRIPLSDVSLVLSLYVVQASQWY